MTTILWDKVFETLREDDEDAKVDYFHTRVAMEKGLAEVYKVRKQENGWYLVFFKAAKHSIYSLPFNEEELVIDSNQLE